MRVGPITPTVPMPGRRRRSTATRLNDRRFGSEMLGADHDRQPGAVDVLVQQLHEPLLLFDHLQQRLQRAERQPVSLVEQRRGAVDVHRPRRRADPRTSTSPAAARAPCSAS